MVWSKEPGAILRYSLARSHSGLAATLIQDWGVKCVPKAWEWMGVKSRIQAQIWLYIAHLTSWYLALKNVNKVSSIRVLSVRMMLAAETEKPYISVACQHKILFLTHVKSVWQQGTAKEAAFRDPSWHGLCHLWPWLPRSLWPTFRGKWRKRGSGRSDDVFRGQAWKRQIHFCS